MLNIDVYSRKFAAVAGACALALVSVTACSGAAKDDAPSALLPTAVKDVNALTLPLDPILIVSNSPKQRFADDIKLATCLSEKGQNFPIIPRDGVIPQDPRETPSHVRIVNTDTVKKYGYDKISDLDPVYTEYSRKAHEWAVSPEGQASNRDMFFACVAETEKKYGFTHFHDTGSSLALQGINNVVTLDQDNPKVAATVKKWRECMGVLNIKDLPDGPSEMPPSSKFDQWGYNVTDYHPFVGPSADEVAVGTKDVECRTSSGYTEAYYAAAWDTETKFIEEHKEALEKEFAKATTLLQESEKVIAGYDGRFNLK